MKIVIDARFLGPEGYGVGNYVENLLENLVRIDTQNKYVVLLKKSNYNLFKPKSKNFKKVLADAHWYSVREQVLIPRLVKKEKPDLVHFPHFNVPLAFNGKFVVTIHDLTLSKHGKEISGNRLYPNYLLKRFLYMKTINKAVHDSEKILVPTKTVKEEILDRFSVPKEKITATHEAADQFITKIYKQDYLNKYNVKKPYILTVGNSYPYKNIKVVINALNNLPKNISLVHVSKKDVFSLGLAEYAREKGFEDRFKFIGPVHQKDLINLYKGAKAFIFPSKSEGFGLPGLEAMAVGCPVVASDIDVFKEVYGEASLYFDTNNAKDLARNVRLILENDSIREKKITSGLEQVKKYSWKKLAKETLDVYNSVL